MMQMAGMSGEKRSLPTAQLPGMQAGMQYVPCIVPLDQGMQLPFGAVPIGQVNTSQVPAGMPVFQMAGGQWPGGKGGGGGLGAGGVGDGLGPLAGWKHQGTELLSPAGFQQQPLASQSGCLAP